MSSGSKVQLRVKSYLVPAKTAAIDVNQKNILLIHIETNTVKVKIMSQSNTGWSFKSIA